MSRIGSAEVRIGMTKASLLFLFFSVTGAAVAAAGCNGQVATVLATDDAGASPSGEEDACVHCQSPDAQPGAMTKECAAAGGVCLADGSSAPPDRTPSSGPLCQAGYTCWVPVDPSPVAKNCTMDQECNGNVAMSSLMGTCFEGMCICHAPYHVQPNGKCGTAQPPECAASVGTCRQDPAECNPGELQGAMATNMSCGDFVAALCCYASSACKTTVDFVCCGASTTPYEPTCVNGWRTCDGGGPMPMLRKAKCGP